MSSLAIRASSIPFTLPATQGKESQISKIAQKVLAFLKEVFSYPGRFLGSKTWSIPGLILKTPWVLFKRCVGISSPLTLKEELFGGSYQFSPTPLSKSEAERFLPSATMSTAVHNCTDKWKEGMAHYNYNVVSPTSLLMNLSQLPGKIEANETRFFDPTSGLKAMVLENGEEIVISFGALGAPRAEIKDEAQRLKLEKHLWKNVINNNLFGGRPELYDQADALVAAINKNFPEKKIKLVGHCMGGSLASFVGIKRGIEVHAFNTLALGPGIQNKLGFEKLAKASRYVTHISVENDFFSDCKYVSGLDCLSNLLGLRTPGNFGRHYRIKASKDYKEQDPIHNYFLGSMMEYVGYTNRTMPQQLKESRT